MDFDVKILKHGHQTKLFLHLLAKQSPQALSLQPLFQPRYDDFLLLWGRPQPLAPLVLQGLCPPWHWRLGLKCVCPGSLACSWQAGLESEALSPGKRVLSSPEELLHITA